MFANVADHVDHAAAHITKAVQESERRIIQCVENKHHGSIMAKLKSLLTAYSAYLRSTGVHRLQSCHNTVNCCRQISHLK